jgi:hypothetical protein
MAAVVAPQHAGLWQRRTDQAIHMPNMNMAGLVPSYDTSRTAANPPTTRAYHASTTQMDMGMPIFQSHTLTTSVPYQSGAFAFESLSVNPYNMQQSFPVSYPPSLPQSVAYSTTPQLQSLPAVREARNAFPMERTPPVKSESSSPVQSGPIYNESAYGDDFKAAASESSDNVNFSTDVDTLMKAIQAKQKTSTPRPQPAKVMTPRLARLSPTNRRVGRGTPLQDEFEAQEALPM